MNKSKTKLVTLPVGYMDCERGNVWLTDDLNHVSYFKLPEKNCWLLVEITPENYPGFYFGVVKRTEKEIAKRLRKCKGWFVRKCNIKGVRISPNGEVA